MNLTIQHQENYSRSKLLLRGFFGWLYIVPPHYFLLFFLGIWATILWFLSFSVILFTGKYPKNWFEFQVRFIRWWTRVQASFLNLYDGYPQFGLSSEEKKVQLEVRYPEKMDRGKVLLIGLFGTIFVLLPHGIALFFRILLGTVLWILAWWVVLFTGKYPKNWHRFHVGTIRWGLRVWFYILFIKSEYPPFSGKES